MNILIIACCNNTTAFQKKKVCQYRLGYLCRRDVVRHRKTVKCEAAETDCVRTSARVEKKNIKLIKNKEKLQSIKCVYYIYDRLGIKSMHTGIKKNHQIQKYLYTIFIQFL